jgi:hypothetical protein
LGLDPRLNEVPREEPESPTGTTLLLTYPEPESQETSSISVECYHDHSEPETVQPSFISVESIHSNSPSTPDTHNVVEQRVAEQHVVESNKDGAEGQLPDMTESVLSGLSNATSEGIEPPIDEFLDLLFHETLLYGLIFSYDPIKYEDTFRATHRKLHPQVPAGAHRRTA